MNNATRTCLTALLFAAMIPAAVSSLEAQASPSKKSKVAATEPTTDEERVAEDKARFQQEQDRVNEELYRQMASMKQDVLRETLNRMRRGGGNEQLRNGDVAAFTIFVLLLMAVLWLIRTILENRRWTRVAAIQTETHNKLLDRMTSSQELMAYMESEAGRRFLESAPFQIEGSSVAPYARILWSAQLGIIILTVGVAFLWLQGQVSDHAQAMLVYGTLSLALGIGCILSAGFSFVLSKSLGLVQKPEHGQH